ncbi:hypothetical protein ACJO2E_02615 [Marinobacter sp. M1N3S26]|uniref:hypothetical protein n=1 Tax=Marinobacter sp. M1N3S26 TaxID=3382299 RepID=UPI00387A8440
MTDALNAKVRHLVGIARAANLRVLAAKRLGFRHPGAEFLRSKAIMDARLLRRDAGGSSGNSLKMSLARLADLTCEIDEEKNRLPEQYRYNFEQVVEGTHDYIKAIAEYHGLTIYMEQREAAPHEKQTH